MSAFQRYMSTNDSAEIDEFSLSELRSANQQYGQRDLNAGFRIALLDRIKEIEEENANKRAGKIRAGGIIVAFVVAISATVVSAILLGWIHK